jgi:hypothetical protein
MLSPNQNAATGSVLILPNFENPLIFVSGDTGGIRIVRLPIFVFGSQQVVLGFPQMLGAEEGKCINCTSGVYRKGSWHPPIIQDVLDYFASGREKPSFSFIVRGYPVVPNVEPGLCFLDCVATATTDDLGPTPAYVENPDYGP